MIQTNPNWNQPLHICITMQGEMFSRKKTSPVTKLIVACQIVSVIFQYRQQFIFINCLPCYSFIFWKWADSQIANEICFFLYFVDTRCAFDAAVCRANKEQIELKEAPHSTCCPTACPMIYAPVCGTDNRTYRM